MHCCYQTTSVHFKSGTLSVLNMSFAVGLSWGFCQVLIVIIWYCCFFRWSERNLFAKLLIWSRKLRKKNTMTHSGKSLVLMWSLELLRITPIVHDWLSFYASSLPIMKVTSQALTSMWKEWKRSKTKSISWQVPAERRYVSVEERGRGEKNIMASSWSSTINIVNCVFAVNVETPCLRYCCSSLFLVPTFVKLL